MDDVKYFPYGEKELAYLRKKDKKLSAVIDRVGHIERAVDDDLFSAVVHHIVGQQISTKAQATVWARVQTPSARSMPNTFWAMAKQICSRSAFRSARRNTSQTREKGTYGRI